jgi:hypothetical protein
VVASSVSGMTSAERSDLPGTAAGCVDELAEIEALKSALCARQARLVGQIADLQPDVSRRSLGREVGLARRESPHRGRRLATMGLALVDDHPAVLELLETGVINERRAELITTETADLPMDCKPGADRDIAAAVAADPTMGDRALVEAARRVVHRLDPTGATRRREKAISRRHVTTTSHGDGTATVHGVVADHHMVAIMQSLQVRADTLRATGQDDRTRAQIVADLFVERLTGQSTAASVPIAIQLVVSAETLLGDGSGSDEPGHLPGAGPVPAPVARRLAAESAETGTTVRRLFSDADRLVAMESTATAFTGLLRRFVRLRDQRCRTPWCNAPIRHLDHVTPRADGGPTTAHNAAGLCEDCNLAKEDPGWRHRVTSTDVERHEVEVVSPTGHTARSRAPDPPRAGPAASYVETRPGLWTRAA